MIDRDKELKDLQAFVSEHLPGAIVKPANEIEIYQLLNYTYQQIQLIRDKKHQDRVMNCFKELVRRLAASEKACKAKGWEQ